MESWILTVAGKLLRLPPRAVCTACTYLQHYQQRQHHPEVHIAAAAKPDAKMLVAACLLLASKVEEAAVSNNHLLNLVSMLHELLTVHNVPPSRILGAQQACLAEAASRGCCKERAGAETASAGADIQQGCSATAAPPPPPPPSSCAHIQQGMRSAEDLEHGNTQRQPQQHQYEHQPEQQQQQQQQGRQEQADAHRCDLQHALSCCEVLVGDAYYAAKSQLLLAEQVVLRLLRFRLPTPHPTAALLHIAAVLRVPTNIASASLRLLHDATTFSTVLLPLPFSSSSSSSSGRMAKQPPGLANTSRSAHTGYHPGTSSHQPSKQEGQQRGESRRRPGGGERDMDECSWGVVAEEDELEGRMLLAELMANNGQRVPKIGLKVAGEGPQTQRGSHTQPHMGPHPQLHMGSVQSEAQGAPAVGQQGQLESNGSNSDWAATAGGQRGNARTQWPTSPVMGSHRSLLQEGAPLIPEGSDCDHLLMELHEVLVGAACLHLANCLLGGGQGRRESHARDHSPMGVAQHQQEPRVPSIKPPGEGQHQQKPQARRSSTEGVGEQLLAERIGDPGPSHSQQPEGTLSWAGAESLGNGWCWDEHAHQDLNQNQTQPQHWWQQHVWQQQHHHRHHQDYHHPHHHQWQQQQQQQQEQQQWQQQQQATTTSSAPGPPAAFQQPFVLYPPSPHDQGHSPHCPQPHLKTLQCQGHPSHCPQSHLALSQGHPSHCTESHLGALQGRGHPSCCPQAHQATIQGHPSHCPRAYLVASQGQGHQVHCLQAHQASLQGQGPCAHHPGAPLVAAEVGLCSAPDGCGDGGGCNHAGTGDDGGGVCASNHMQTSGTGGCSGSAGAGCDGGVSGEDHPRVMRHAGRKRRYRERKLGDRESSDDNDGGNGVVDVGVAGTGSPRAAERGFVAQGASNEPVFHATSPAPPPQAPTAADAAAADDDVVAAAPAPAVLQLPALPPLPQWTHKFGLEPEAVEAVAAVVLGAIARTKRELAALENRQQRH